MCDYSDDDPIVDASFFANFANKKGEHIFAKYANIPQELKDLNQWICFKSETTDDGRIVKKPKNPKTWRKTNFGYVIYNVDPTDINSCVSFNTAVNACSDCPEFDGIGFCLFDSDPYTIIDLDNPEKLDSDGNLVYALDVEKHKATHLEILKHFPSYAERSPSGKGWHIVIKGKLGYDVGRNKRECYEMYSRQRYMTFTGDGSGEIQDHSQQLLDLQDYIFGPIKCAMPDSTKAVDAELDGPERYTDAQIYEFGCINSNTFEAQKFKDLCEGLWYKYYPGNRSAADIALCNKFATYTDSKSQVLRLWLLSKLRTGSEYHDDINFRHDADDLAKKFRVDYQRNTVNEAFNKTPKAPIPDFTALNSRFEATTVKPKKKNELVCSFPNGLIGEISQFIFDQSRFPCTEISLIGALSLFGGIVSRYYNVEGLALNMNYALLADSSRGKESAAHGMSKIMNEVAKLQPKALQFQGPGKIVSAPALLRQLEETPCFCSVFGEFDTFLGSLTGKYVDSRFKELYSLLLDLYGKSGQSAILTGTVYSDKVKNIKPIRAPNLTFTGECTPTGFFDNVDESTMMRGFLPRMLIVHVTSDSPHANRSAHKHVPSKNIVISLAHIVARSIELSDKNETQEIRYSDDIYNEAMDYENFCVDKKTHYNKRGLPVLGLIWSRVFGKTVKLSGILAVADDSKNPTITRYHYEWAKNLVMMDVKMMISKFENNEVGANNEEPQQLKLMNSFLFEYIHSKYDDLLASSKQGEKMHKDHVIKYSSILAKCNNLAAFKHNGKVTQNCKQTIESLIKCGILQDIGVNAFSKYGTNAVCYGIKLGEM